MKTITVSAKRIDPYYTQVEIWCEGKPFWRGTHQLDDLAGVLAAHVRMAVDGDGDIEQRKREYVAVRKRIGLRPIRRKGGLLGAIRLTDEYGDVDLPLHPVKIIQRAIRSFRYLNRSGEAMRPLKLKDLVALYDEYVAAEIAEPGRESTKFLKSSMPQTPKKAD